MKAPDPRRVAAGVAWGVLLVALGLLLHPALLQVWRQARLLAADPPASLPVPVDGVRPSGLVDTWGAARSGGRRHEGIDIFARRRTPVRSTTEGIVTRRGGNPLGGRTVTVLGPGGWRHYYAHLDRYGAWYARRGRLVNVEELVVNGHKALQGMLLRSDEASVEEITLIESGDGRVVVVTAECARDHYDVYAPWFDAVLETLEIEPGGAP